MQLSASTSSLLWQAVPGSITTSTAGFPSCPCPLHPICFCPSHCCPTEQHPTSAGTWQAFTSRVPALAAGRGTPGQPHAASAERGSLGLQSPPVYTLLCREHNGSLLMLARAIIKDTCKIRYITSGHVWVQEGCYPEVMRSRVVKLFFPAFPRFSLGTAGLKPSTHLLNSFFLNCIKIYSRLSARN